MQQEKNISMEYDWRYSSFWPFNGMVNDLWRGIQAGQNYLVALGLFVYSEYLGRQILDTLENKDDGLVPYREFTETYVGYCFSEEKWRLFFDSFRNGLAHRYFIKQSGSSVLNDPGNFSCGIEVTGATYKIFIHSYFLHFVQGLEKALDAGVINGHNGVDEPVALNPV